MRRFRLFPLSSSSLLAILIGMLALSMSRYGEGQSALTLLYSFTPPPDGKEPEAGVIMDPSGNLYGTTYFGGADGYGAVFELTNSSGIYTEKVLYSFTNSGGDGDGPLGGLIMDSSGNLYGTTEGGGTSGNGTVFELINSSGTYSEKVLYSFAISPDGSAPYGSLIMDSSGNLYGATWAGGGYNRGTVFELINSSGSYSEKVLYSFKTSDGDGENPAAGLIMDSLGNLYGTTYQGGSYGYGTVFELTNSSGTYTEKVLYSFTNSGGNGSNPLGGVILDSSGNLYGTTYHGGASGNGTVFELINASGTYSEKVLYSFKTSPDGSGPYYEDLMMDSSGNLYGTTISGGSDEYGTVFELVNSSGAYGEKVLYSFTNSGGNGDGPLGGVIMDSSGNLYGNTLWGGSYGDGSVFGVSPVIVAVTSSPNPSNFSQAVTLIATLSLQRKSANGTPVGTVSFYNGKTNIGTSDLNNGDVATLTTSALSVGTHSITATYNGDSNYLPSTSAVLFQVVQGASVSLSSASLSFGDQTVGIKSKTESVTLTNTGNIPLTISIAITGTDSADFSQSNTCGSSVSAGAKCTITVDFKPLGTGTRTAAVQITDNAHTHTQYISLSGIGVSPAVTFSPTSLTFPTQVVYTTGAVKTVKLTNSGLGLLVIGKIAVTGPFTQTHTCGSTLSAGGSCTISVSFKPTTKGTLTGAVLGSDNAPDNPQKVTLTGTGTYIELMPASVNFGNQPEGTKSLAKTVTVTNQGAASVSLTGISITGSDAGDFAQTHTCGKTLASGASCFIKVTFKPAVTGTRTAQLNMTDNGGGSPQTVTLTGTGTP